MQTSSTLQEVVDEIVTSANARDKRGRHIEPMMAIPTVTMIFHSRDALLDVLENRPIALLNLISTNKEVAQFMGAHENWLWVKVIDLFVAKETDSAYMGEVYPFFLTQEFGSVAARLTPFVADKPKYIKDESIGFFPNRTGKITVPFQFKASRGRIRIGWLKPRVPYYLVKYDRLTKFYFSYMQKLMDINNPPFRAAYVPYGDDKWLKEYVGDEVSFIAFHDYFVVDTEKPVFKYNLFALQDKLSSTWKELQEHRDEARRRIDAVYRMHLKEEELLIMDLLEDAVKSAKSVQEELNRTTIINYASPVPLDKITTRPYRQALFNKEKGLYNTAYKQKQLLVDLLRSLNKWNNKQELINKYGTLFQCVYCGNDAHFVDSTLTLTLCDNEMCHM